MEEMSKEMYRMLETRSIERLNWHVASATLEPLTYVSVSAKEVIITADLPCSDMKSVNIKPLKKNIIEIKAKTKRIISFDEFGITHRRGKFSNFYAQIAVPIPVNMAKMKMRCKNGIVEVHIPRKS